MFTIEVESAMPRRRSRRKRIQRGVDREIRERDDGCIQFDCRLKNALLSISIVPLKVRPAEKPQAPGNDGGLAGMEGEALIDETRDRHG